MDARLPLSRTRSAQAGSTRKHLECTLSRVDPRLSPNKQMVQCCFEAGGGMRTINKKLRQNSILVCGLAVYFWWVSEFAKHDPILRTIIPFSDDPYDAVSSYGVIAGTLLALVSATRVLIQPFVRLTTHPTFVVRTQIAVPFCVLVSLSNEAVAMLDIRHCGSTLQAPQDSSLSKPLCLASL